MSSKPSVLVAAIDWTPVMAPESPREPRVPTLVRDEAVTPAARVAPLSEPAAALTVFVPAAVTKPLAFTVKFGMAVEEPKDPTFEFTVASVVAKLFAEEVTSPVIAAVCSAVPENASVEPRVIEPAFAVDPVEFPISVVPETCWNFGNVTALAAIVLAQDPAPCVTSPVVAGSLAQATVNPVAVVPLARVPVPVIFA